jgi:beta-galactosidase
VGSALPDGLQYYRVKRLKEMRCNAYRTSHNPPALEPLDACDRLGMLVVDETRELIKKLSYIAKRDGIIHNAESNETINSYGSKVENAKQNQWLLIYVRESKKKFF